METTNYFNTLIEVAEDCPIDHAEVPQERGGKKTIALLQYEIIAANPYKYTSDDVIFQVHADRKDIPQSQRVAEREKFFSKGQPCLRSSPLTKRYGWGVHSNADGKIAPYAMESQEYKDMAQTEDIKSLKAMRSKRA
ncbi:MAG: hypothetical protein DWQ07_22505 [Chloroflexi bacterium]|nr:MAG: hypothetical protein DWQ07_22505 [Chloroflexota bacterium]MBL1193920.1 hypothetical protein [Chloroflexota bacterium]NOH11214.1 hypothetical protein [Chloroflexota bacterium]